MENVSPTSVKRDQLPLVGVLLHVATLRTGGHRKYATKLGRELCSQAQRVYGGLVEMDEGAIATGEWNVADSTAKLLDFGLLCAHGLSSAVLSCWQVKGSCDALLGCASEPGSMKLRLADRSSAVLDEMAAKEGRAGASASDAVHQASRYLDCFGPVEQMGNAAAGYGSFIATLVRLIEFPTLSRVECDYFCSGLDGNVAANMTRSVANDGLLIQSLRKTSDALRRCITLHGLSTMKCTDLCVLLMSDMYSIIRDDAHAVDGHEWYGNSDTKDAFVQSVRHTMAAVVPESVTNGLFMSPPGLKKRERYVDIIKGEAHYRVLERDDAAYDYWWIRRCTLVVYALCVDLGGTCQSPLLKLGDVLHSICKLMRQSLVGFLDNKDDTCHHQYLMIGSIRVGAGLVRCGAVSAANMAAVLGGCDCASINDEWIKPLSEMTEEWTSSEAANKACLLAHGDCHRGTIGVQSTGSALRRLLFCAPSLASGCEEIALQYSDYSSYARDISSLYSISGVPIVVVELCAVLAWQSATCPGSRGRELRVAVADLMGSLSHFIGSLAGPAGSVRDSWSAPLFGMFPCFGRLGVAMLWGEGAQLYARYSPIARGNVPTREGASDGADTLSALCSHLERVGACVDDFVPPAARTRLASDASISEADVVEAVRRTAGVVPVAGSPGWVRLCDLDPCHHQAPVTDEVLPFAFVVSVCGRQKGIAHSSALLGGKAGPRRSLKAVVPVLLNATLRMFGGFCGGYPVFLEWLCDLMLMYLSSGCSRNWCDGLLANGRVRGPSVGEAQWVSELHGAHVKQLCGWLSDGLLAGLGLSCLSTGTYPDSMESLLAAMTRRLRWKLVFDTWRSVEEASRVARSRLCAFVKEGQVHTMGQRRRLLDVVGAFVARGVERFVDRLLKRVRTGRVGRGRLVARLKWLICASPITGGSLLRPVRAVDDAKLRGELVRSSGPQVKDFMAYITCRIIENGLESSDGAGAGPSSSGLASLADRGIIKTLSNFVLSVASDASYDIAAYNENSHVESVKKLLRRVRRDSGSKSANTTAIFSSNYCEDEWGVGGCFSVDGVLEALSVAICKKGDVEFLEVLWLMLADMGDLVCTADSVHGRDVSTDAIESTYCVDPCVRFVKDLQKMGHVSAKKSSIDLDLLHSCMVEHPEMLFLLSGSPHGNHAALRYGDPGFGTRSVLQPGLYGILLQRPLLWCQLFSAASHLAARRSGAFAGAMIRALRGGEEQSTLDDRRFEREESARGLRLGEVAATVVQHLQYVAVNYCKSPYQLLRVVSCAIRDGFDGMVRLCKEYRDGNSRVTGLGTCICVLLLEWSKVACVQDVLSVLASLISIDLWAEGNEEVLCDPTKQVSAEWVQVASSSQKLPLVGMAHPSVPGKVAAMVLGKEERERGADMVFRAGCRLGLEPRLAAEWVGASAQASTELASLAVLGANDAWRSGHNLVHVAPVFYAAFWSLRLYDVHFCTRAYDSVRGLFAAGCDTIALTSAAAHKKHVEFVGRLLGAVRVSQRDFIRNQASTSSRVLLSYSFEVVQTCLLPRLTRDGTGPLYCVHFVEEMMDSSSRHIRNILGDVAAVDSEACKVWMSGPTGTCLSGDSWECFTPDNVRALYEAGRKHSALWDALVYDVFSPLQILRCVVQLILPCAMRCRKSELSRLSVFIGLLVKLLRARYAAVAAFQQTLCQKLCEASVPEKTARQQCAFLGSLLCLDGLFVTKLVGIGNEGSLVETGGRPVACPQVPGPVADGIHFISIIGHELAACLLSLLRSDDPMLWNNVAQLSYKQAKDSCGPVVVSVAGDGCENAAREGASRGRELAAWTTAGFFELMEPRGPLALFFPFTDSVLYESFTAGISRYMQGLPATHEKKGLCESILKVLKAPSPA